MVPHVLLLASWLDVAKFAADLALAALTLAVALTALVMQTRRNRPRIRIAKVQSTLNLNEKRFVLVNEGIDVGLVSGIEIRTYGPRWWRRSKPAGTGRIAVSSHEYAGLSLEDLVAIGPGEKVDARVLLSKLALGPRGGGLKYRAIAQQGTRYWTKVPRQGKTTDMD